MPPTRVFMRYLCEMVAVTSVRVSLLKIKFSLTITLIYITYSPRTGAIVTV